MANISVPVHKVIIIDDHALVAHGLESIFTAQEDMEVIKCISDPKLAVAEVRHLKPDLVTLDLGMPKLHGADLIEPLQKASPDTRIIVLTGLSDMVLLAEVHAKKPHGIMQKMGNPQELLDAIRVSAGGPPILCSECRGMMAKLDQTLETMRPLSRREREIVGLLADGNTTKDIADLLNISEHTVRKHRENSLDKLGAKSTGQLVALATRRGFIE